MKEFSSEKASFEFLAITGRTYSLEMSSDLKEWKKTDFNLSDDNDKESYSHIIAGKVGNVTVDVPLLDGEIIKKLFFKLKVQ